MNYTNQEAWFPRCRMAWLERRAQNVGHVGRADLMTMFGTSAAQTSADFQAYIAANPGALAYSMTRKRYEWVEGSKLVITPAPWDALKEENDETQTPT